jgi:hypothetical protein
VLNPSLTTFGQAIGRVRLSLPGKSIAVIRRRARGQCVLTVASPQDALAASKIIVKRKAVK